MINLGAGAVAGSASASSSPMRMKSHAAAGISPFSSPLRASAAAVSRPAAVAAGGEGGGCRECVHVHSSSSSLPRRKVAIESVDEGDDTEENEGNKLLEGRTSTSTIESTEAVPPTSSSSSDNSMCCRSCGSTEVVKKVSMYNF